MSKTIDLTNCDREPIHIPGKIQSHGILIGFNKHSGIITHVSDNVALYFNASPSSLLNKPFDQFLTVSGMQIGNSGSAALMKEQIIAGTDKESSLIAHSEQNGSFHLIPHLSGENVVLEMEAALEEKHSEVQYIISSLLTKILGAKSLTETLAFSAAQVKSIIGYDRVMIYKFAEDGHGEVVAEEVNDGFEPFLGLHYPASDIPKQARELYKRNLVRIISDVDSTDSFVEVNDEITAATPLDLSDSVLRAVSPIHIQYLKNMGVKSSFSVSLLSDGELWGLIACHNYVPRTIDYKKRNSCKIIGQLLSTSVIFREAEENKEQRSTFSDKLEEMVKAVRKDGDMKEVVLSDSASLLDISEASGAALVFEGKVYSRGETPDEAEIINLCYWLQANAKTQFYQTDKLSRNFPEAISYRSVASGIMACVLSKELNEYLFWFKKEQLQTVNWAGNPDKPVVSDENGMLSLSPRHSFELWTQEVEAVSAPWFKNEITMALKLREELSQVINERANQIRKLNEKLKHAYDELDTFSFTISHDLKTPLSSLKNYTEILLEADSTNEESKPMLKKIVKGADKMNVLIREVLRYSRIGRLDIKLKKIKMATMLEEIKSELLVSYKGNTPQIRVINAHDIYGDYTMIYQVFMNLIGNAVKYSSTKETPEINIDAISDGNEVRYSISDNGIGIDMKTGDQVFELFKRMNNAGDFEGTGVGLAIVKRICSRHHAKIWYESEPGNGTIFYISFKISSNDI